MARATRNRARLRRSMLVVWYQYCCDSGVASWVMALQGVGGAPVRQPGACPAARYSGPATARLLG